MPIRKQYKPEPKQTSTWISEKVVEPVIKQMGPKKGGIDASGKG